MMILKLPNCFFFILESTWTILWKLMLQIAKFTIFMLLWRFPTLCSARLTNTSHTSIPGVVTRGVAHGGGTSTVQQRGFWPRTDKRFQGDWANTRAKLSSTKCHSTCVADTHNYASHSHQHSAETNFVLVAKYISNWMVLILVAWPPGLLSSATHDLCQHENQLASLSWKPVISSSNVPMFTP